MASLGLRGFNRVSVESERNAANLFSQLSHSILPIMPIAKQEVDPKECLILSNRDRELFMSTMENPPTLKGSLKSAIQKYREKYDQ